MRSAPVAAKMFDMRIVKGDMELGRLRKRREFVAAAKGRRHHTPLFSLQAVTGADRLDGLRVGLTVTKKNGSATERNRIRRRLRAALCEIGGECRDWRADLVVVGRRDILAAPFAQLTAELAGAVTSLRRRTDRVAPALNTLPERSQP